MAHPWRPARVRVGTVGRPHGLHGAFHVSGPCGWWDFPAGSALLVDGGERHIATVAGTPSGPIVQLDGVDDREAAAALTRGRARAAGRRACRSPRRTAGSASTSSAARCSRASGAWAVVAAVEDGVAHDILLLDDEAGTRIPFVGELVPGVDVPGRRLEVVEWLGEAPTTE